MANQNSACNFIGSKLINPAFYIEKNIAQKAVKMITLQKLCELIKICNLQTSENHLPLLFIHCKPNKSLLLISVL